MTDLLNLTHTTPAVAIMSCRVDLEPLDDIMARTRAPGSSDTVVRVTRRWRETDSNSRSPVGGDTPQRPQITSLPIIFP
jgi:hypothetical protein